MLIPRCGCVVAICHVCFSSFTVLLLCAYVYGLNIIFNAIYMKLSNKSHPALRMMDGKIAHDGLCRRGRRGGRCLGISVAASTLGLQVSWVHALLIAVALTTS
mmetsp:Transcript_25060/g.50069  ORF Transcript_25060/g.50069 Transcript_25060/m.50069 type:complete len:103 (-) Transcript_25060:10-318(-)